MLDEITLNATTPHRSSWAQVAIDLVLFTVIEGRLHVLLVSRDRSPFEGGMVLPGARLLAPQSLEQAAYDLLFEQIGPLDINLEQFHTFGDPDRDPRRWVISVSYVGVVSPEALKQFVGVTQPAMLAEVLMEDQVGCALIRHDGRFITIGFDHDHIIFSAVRHLRAAGDCSLAAFRLLPPEFTLLELQQVHEAIMAGALNKPLFRKQALKRIFADGTCLQPTGRQKRSGRHRPAMYYCRVPAKREAEQKRAGKSRLARREP